MVMLKSCLAAFAAVCGLAVTCDAYAFVSRSSSRALYTASSSTNSMSMKIYDWKRRTADESSINDVDNFVFTLDNLKSAPGARKRKNRKGRGIAAGQGASCGFGMRGQKSRSGNPTRPGFEGGQTPLYRRLPKFAGKPTGPGHTKKVYSLVTTDHLAKAAPGSTVNYESLEEGKIITKSKYKTYKIVMGKDSDAAVASGLTVQAHKFTESARAAIEAAGGKCELLSRTTGQVLQEAE